MLLGSLKKTEEIMKKRMMFGIALSTVLAGCLCFGVLTACDKDNAGGDADSETTNNNEQVTGTGNGAGNSIATDPIEGVWSGATLDRGLFWLGGKDTFTVTVDLFEDALHDGYVVVKAVESTDSKSADIYIPMGVDKQDDGTYTGTFVVDDPTDPYNFTAKIEDNKLIATVDYRGGTTLTFTQKEGFPQAILPEGTLYLNNMFLPYGFDFVNKTVKVGEQTVPANVYHIGQYISVMTQIGGESVESIVADVGFAVYQKGSGYTAYSVLTALAMEEREGIDLVSAPPAFNATVNFAYGVGAEDGAAVPASVSPASPNAKFELPDVPNAKPGYKFVAWQSSDSEYGMQYGKASDMVSMMECGLLTASETIYAHYEPIKYSVVLEKGDATWLTDEAWNDLDKYIGGAIDSAGTRYVSLNAWSQNMTFPIGNTVVGTDSQQYRLKGWKVGNTELPASSNDPSRADFTLTSDFINSYDFGGRNVITFTAVWEEVTA